MHLLRSLPASSLKLLYLNGLPHPAYVKMRGAFCHAVEDRLPKMLQAHSCGFGLQIEDMEAQIAEMQQSSAALSEAEALLRQQTSSLQVCPKLYTSPLCKFAAHLFREGQPKCNSPEGAVCEYVDFDRLPPCKL